MKFLYLIMGVLILSGCGDMFGGNKVHTRSKYYLYQMNPDGSDKDKICKLDEEQYNNFVVSPDGNYFAGRLENDNFRVIDLELGEDIINDSIFSYNGFYPEFSANSKYVGYAIENNLNILNLETDGLDQTSYENLGRRVIFQDSTHLIFTSLNGNENIANIYRRDLSNGSEEIIYSCETAYQIEYIRVRENDLYFILYQYGTNSYNYIIRHVNLEEGNFYNFNSHVSYYPFNISPDGTKIVAKSRYGSKLRVYSSDGMDYVDIFEGADGVFIDNENIAFQHYGDINVGYWDGSAMVTLTENHPFFYNSNLDKIFYLKEKKIYE